MKIAGVALVTATPGVRAEVPALRGSMCDRRGSTPPAMLARDRPKEQSGPASGLRPLTPTMHLRVFGPESGGGPQVVSSWPLPHDHAHRCRRYV